jgi:hypothetical protein
MVEAIRSRPLYSRLYLISIHGAYIDVYQNPSLRLTDGSFHGVVSDPERCRLRCSRRSRQLLNVH